MSAVEPKNINIRKIKTSDTNTYKSSVNALIMFKNGLFKEE